MNQAVATPTNTTLSFKQLPLRPELLKSLDSLNYEEMTPVQSQSLPLMLESKDVIAQAKTGSGKTAAFGLTLLNNLKIEFFGAQALVLCPTRELADQVSQAIRRLACLMPNVKVVNLSGGIPMKPQLDSLRHGAHVIVGTPGRVLKHIAKESLNLTQLKTLVLDEADRMLDMGFFDDIKTILSVCAKQRQTLLFSATFPDEIKQISKQFMRNPTEIIIDTPEEELDIEQIFYEVAHKNDKFKALKTLLGHFKPSSTLIFCNTKLQTQDLNDLLVHAGYSSIALNGDMEQYERDLAIIRFTNQSCAILVATDVAARGLDIKNLPAVINYELAFEQDVHVHRVGRTGRAGSKGLALSITTPADAQRLCDIEAQSNQSITWGQISQLPQTEQPIATPEMVTLCIAGGKKEKIRAGDILGALTKDAGLKSEVIGKIDIGQMHSYVAIHKSQANNALSYLQNGKLKGRSVYVRKV